MNNTTREFKRSLAVFTWARITFRKTFRITIQNVELRAVTCIVNAFPITIRICALRGMGAKPGGGGDRGTRPISAMFFFSYRTVRAIHKGLNNPKQPRHISESRIAQWARSRVRDSTRCIVWFWSSPVSYFILFYFILFHYHYFCLTEVEIYSVLRQSCARDKKFVGKNIAPRGPAGA